MANATMTEYPKSRHTLKRSPLVSPEGDFPDDTLKAAATKLNYRAAPPRDAMVRLLQQRCGVLPFTQESVRKYKSRVDTLPFWFAATLTATIVYCVASVGLLLTGLIMSEPNCGLAWTLMSLAYTGMWVYVRHLYPEVPIAKFWETQLSWNEHSLSHYSGAVPEFVLQTAIHVKDTLSEHRCEFQIERIEANRRPKTDPFLRVNIDGSDWLYLEVWNEPKFTQTREV